MKTPKGEMPHEESARRKAEQQEMFKRAAATRAAEQREADEQRIWQQDQNHSTH